jgi:iron complex outermembrane receptor protein
MGAVLNLSYDLGGATLTSVTGYETMDMYSRGDIDGGFGACFFGGCGPGFVPFDAQSADGLPDLDQITQEVRVASDTDGQLDWIAGFYYFDESLRAETFNYLSGGTGDVQFGYAFQDQDAKSWALFGSLDYELNELWSFQFGARYTTDEKDFVAERPEAFFTNVPTTAPIVRSTDADLVTWDLTATRTVNDNLNFYGRVGTGFRAPSIQGRILFCQDFGDAGQNPDTNCVSIAEEEEILSAEIGMKSELLDRKLRLNLAVYQYEVDGQQLVAVGGLSNTARLLNADTTDGYGFEADIDWAPTSSWLVTLGTSYNHTEIDDPSLLIAPCFACTIEDPIVGGLVQIDGNPLPHAPEWIFNGIVDYRRAVGDGLFLFSFDWAWSSEKNFFLYESKEFESDSFELGARLGYLFPGGVYEVAAFARNLTDEEIVQGGIDFNNLTGMMNEPRQVGVELVARW